MSGTLIVRKPDGASRILSVKSEVFAGDTLATAEETYARVKFNDGGEVTLRPATQFQVREYSYDSAKPESDNIALSLLKGGLRSITGAIGKRNREKFEMSTPSGTIGIRGTIYGALQCNNDCANVKTAAGTVPENGLHVDIGQGEIAVTNATGTRNYTAGQYGFVRDVNTQPALVPAANAPKPPPPPPRFETGRAGVGKGSATECAI